MRKLVFITMVSLLLVACGSNDKNEPDQVPNDSENNTEENDSNIENETNDTNNEALEDPSNSDLDSNDGSSNESDENEMDEEVSDENETEEESKSEVTEIDDLVDLTFAIFEAQNNEDYDFLASILSSGASMDEDTNVFTFDDVTYPHEQEFITEENGGDLEYRYTDDENENSVIVGFAAVDYENEYSFVIDFEFVKEDGSFKMNDMDINK